MGNSIEDRAPANPSAFQEHEGDLQLDEAVDLSSYGGGSAGTDPASDYAYGVQGLSARSGPFSPTDMLVWLQQHSSGVNDQLRERILHADMRGKLVKDLNHLKAEVTASSVLDAVNGYPDLKGEAEALIEAYKGTPFEAAATEAVDSLLGNPDDALSESEAGKVDEQIQGVIDALGKDDQMDMIYIQQLTNRINEQFGFASNFVAKHNDTVMAIVANV